MPTIGELQYQHAMTRAADTQADAAVRQAKALEAIAEQFEQINAHLEALLDIKEGKHAG